MKHESRSGRTHANRSTAPAINPALPGVASVTAADVPAAYLGYPNIVAFQTQVQNNPNLLPASFRLSRSVADYNRRDTYVGNWNFALQRQLSSTLGASRITSAPWPNHPISTCSKV